MQIEESEIITGERLQAMADVAVVTRGKRAGHTSMPAMPLAVFPDTLEIVDESLQMLHNARCIYVYSDFLDFFFAKLLPRLAGPVVLMSGNSDVNVDEKYRAALEDPKVRHWFAQNVTVRHPKLTASPIGIANARWPHGDTSALARVAARDIPKRPGLYVNFEVGSNARVRGPILEALSTRPFAVMGRGKAGAPTPKERLRRLLARTPKVQQQPTLPFADYLEELASWKFCVSPPGNGADCHRTWEALYLRVVPVLSQAPIGVLRGLPHIMVSDLRAVELAELETAAEALTGPMEMERLKLSYWRSVIRRAADELR